METVSDVSKTPVSSSPVGDGVVSVGDVYVSMGGGSGGVGVASGIAVECGDVRQTPFERFTHPSVFKRAADFLHETLYDESLHVAVLPKNGQASCYGNEDCKYTAYALAYYPGRKASLTYAMLDSSNTKGSEWSSIEVRKDFLLAPKTAQQRVAFLREQDVVVMVDVNPLEFSERVKDALGMLKPGGKIVWVSEHLPTVDMPQQALHMMQEGLREIVEKGVELFCLTPEDGCSSGHVVEKGYAEATGGMPAKWNEELEKFIGYSLLSQVSDRRHSDGFEDALSRLAGTLASRLIQERIAAGKARYIDSLAKAAKQIEDAEEHKGVFVVGMYEDASCLRWGVDRLGSQSLTLGYHLVRDPLKTDFFKKAMVLLSAYEGKILVHVCAQEGTRGIRDRVHAFIARAYKEMISQASLYSPGGDSCSSVSYDLDLTKIGDNFLDRVKQTIVEGFKEDDVHREIEAACEKVIRKKGSLTKKEADNVLKSLQKDPFFFKQKIILENMTFWNRFFTSSVSKKDPTNKAVVMAYAEYVFENKIFFHVEDALVRSYFETLSVLMEFENAQKWGILNDRVCSDFFDVSGMSLTFWESSILFIEKMMVSECVSEAFKKRMCTIFFMENAFLEAIFKTTGDRFSFFKEELREFLNKPENSKRKEYVFAWDGSVSWFYGVDVELACRDMVFRIDEHLQKEALEKLFIVYREPALFLKILSCLIEYRSFLSLDAKKSVQDMVLLMPTDVLEACVCAPDFFTLYDTDEDRSSAVFLFSARILEEKDAYACVGFLSKNRFFEPVFEGKHDSAWLKLVCILFKKTEYNYSFLDENGFMDHAASLMVLSEVPSVIVDMSFHFQRCLKEAHFSRDIIFLNRTCKKLKERYSNVYTNNSFINFVYIVSLCFCEQEHELFEYDFKQLIESAMRDVDGCDPLSVGRYVYRCLSVVFDVMSKNKERYVSEGKDVSVYLISMFKACRLLSEEKHLLQMCRRMFSNIDFYQNQKGALCLRDCSAELYHDVLILFADPRRSKLLKTDPNVFSLVPHLYAVNLVLGNTDFDVGGFYDLCVSMMDLYSGPQSECLLASCEVVSVVALQRVEWYPSCVVRGSSGFLLRLQAHIRSHPDSVDTQISIIYAVFYEKWIQSFPKDLPIDAEAHSLMEGFFETMRTLVCEGREEQKQDSLLALHSALLMMIKHPNPVIRDQGIDFFKGLLFSGPPFVARFLHLFLHGYQEEPLPENAHKKTKIALKLLAKTTSRPETGGTDTCYTECALAAKICASIRACACRDPDILGWCLSPYFSQEDYEECFPDRRVNLDLNFMLLELYKHKHLKSVVTEEYVAVQEALPALEPWMRGLFYILATSSLCRDPRHVGAWEEYIEKDRVLWLRLRRLWPKYWASEGAVKSPFLDRYFAEKTH